MPSRFTGLAPQSLVSTSPNASLPWDVYDNVPFDPEYAPLTSPASTYRRLSK